MARRTRSTDFQDKMSEAERVEFNRELHNNKLSILISDLVRTQRSMFHIFGYEHADSKLIDNIIKDMEEAKLDG
jgi:hypothetical protein